MSELLKTSEKREGMTLYVFYSFQEFYNYHYVDTIPGMKWRYLVANEVCIVHALWDHNSSYDKFYLVQYQGEFGFIQVSNLEPV